MKAQMVGRSKAMHVSLLAVARLATAGAGVMPAARCRLSGSRPRLAVLRRLAHQPQDVDDAGAEHDEVDDDEGEQRAATAGACSGDTESAVRSRP